MTLRLQTTVTSTRIYLQFHNLIANTDDILLRFTPYTSETFTLSNIFIHRDPNPPLNVLVKAKHLLAYKSGLYVFIFLAYP